MLSTLFLASLLQTAGVLVAAESTPPVRAVDTDRGSKTLAAIQVISRRVKLNDSVSSSLSTIANEVLEQLTPNHPNEIFNQVPGAWISRGSGQEHLTAIRSPVLTGAGACGGFMVLEDQVPTRPAGFCNVNQLFEVNLSQAGKIDVLRGPGTVSYGSNALHGAISVFTPGPSDQTRLNTSLEAANNDFYRGQVELASKRSALQATYTDAGSFRDDENYRHGLINFQASHQLGSAVGRTSFAYANLNQDTAGFILGEDAYKDEQLRKQNLNPDAFRKAWAGRLSSRWNFEDSHGNQFELIPYLRRSKMDFLQHFLPGTPLETNDQTSGGLLFSFSNQRPISAGLDFEWAQGALLEFQENPITQGSAFLRETRPQGFHYNYRVKSTMLAAWLQWQAEVKTDFKLTAGLRAEYLRYHYNNRMLDGNTRDDGSECGFGGCLYTRPADRKDGFSNLSPEIGLDYRIKPGQHVYIRMASGYRAPQATELYRLQKGQAVAELEPETVDSIEVGLFGENENFYYQLVAYWMEKRHIIFRDANGFNISDGRTHSQGIETQLNWQLTDRIALRSNISFANHEYDFNRDLGRAGIIKRGNQVDTAPVWLGSASLHWQFSDKFSGIAQWVYQGDYYLDAANDHSYPGHSLINLRAFFNLNKQQSLKLGLMNLLDTRYAERADYAFGSYRYFPGDGRRISLQWQYRR